MSQKGKVESGAELLARLGPRPVLHDLGVGQVLGFEPQPGDIVELYGGEGVGKTELLLHVVSSALLPDCVGHCCSGNKTEVVWVDCDLKFSVLRLAVLLEQRLMKKLSVPDKDQNDLVRVENAQSDGSCEGVDSKIHVNPGNKHCCDSGETEGVRNGGMCGLGNKGEGLDGVSDKLEREQEGCVLKSDCSKGRGSEENKNQKQGTAIASNIQLQSTHHVQPDLYQQNGTVMKEPATITSNSTSNEASDSDSVRIALKRKAKDVENDKLSSDFDSKTVHCANKSETASTSSPPNVTNEAAVDLTGSEKPSCAEKLDTAEMSGGEEVERRVEACLRRVHVLRCTSSQQLICSLHSLHSLIAANPNIAIVVIDPISAFFWSDKCSDFQHASSFLHRNMAQVASVLKKITASFNVRVTVSKQALVRPRAKEKMETFVSSAKGGKLGGDESHAEFLGWEWGGVVTHRLVCSRSVCQQKGVKTTRYTLSGNATGQKQFVIDESGVHVLGS